MNINRVALFVLTGFLSLTIAMPFFAPITAQAEMSMSGMRKKRYRYRNRTHRVQVGASIIPWNQDKNKSMFIDFDLLYGYNAGLFEIGPNLGLSSPGDGKFTPNLEVGLWSEFNIIKNTRKEKVVPSLGVKVNYLKEGSDNNLLISPYLALKYFPASRTGLVLNVNYDIVTPFNKLFTSMEMGIGFSLAYVHYFHF